MKFKGEVSSPVITMVFMASFIPPVGGPLPTQPPSDEGAALRQDLRQAIQDFTQAFKQERPNAAEVAPTIIALANCAQKALTQKGR